MPMTLPRTLWLPLLACTGCLARDISQQIDGVHCGGTGQTGGSGSETGSGTTECTETTGTGGMSGSMTDSSGTGGSSTTGGASGTDSDSADASSGSSGDTSSSTGAPVAVCGNGIVEDADPQPEECDDGNDDPADGCHNCGRDRLVFITSADYQGHIFDGLGGADQRCRSLADQQDLPGFAGFKAWLSDSTVSARDRMFAGRGRYVLVNGLVVADSWEALLAGELQNPINVTETSETREYQVWTGTNPDGSAAVGSDHCGDWSELFNGNSGFWGRSKYTTSEWTIAEAPVSQPDACFSERALYCFEQE